MNELIFYTGKEAKSNIAVSMCDFDDEVRVKKKPFESALLCFGCPQGVGLFLSAFAYHATVSVDNPMKLVTEEAVADGTGGSQCNTGVFHFYTIAFSTSEYCYNNCTSQYFNIKKCKYYSPFNTCVDYNCTGGCGGCIRM